MARRKLRVSLANKCQLLFGAAVVLIITAALAVGWLRMQTLVLEAQQDTARRLASAWLGRLIELPDTYETPPGDSRRDVMISLVRHPSFTTQGQGDPFLRQAIEQFSNRSDRNEWFTQVTAEDGDLRFRYARAVRRSDLQRMQGSGEEPPSARAASPTPLANPLESVLLITLRSDEALRQLLLNRIYIIAAGLLAGLLAIGTFWYITTRIILSPVRLLKDVAEKVSTGDLNLRSDINTGDEFEQLSDMFNTMLGNLKSNQDQLRSANKSLDLKIGELAASNSSLYEANKIKSEFIANVSHELRTPLNSIVGFAQLLKESLERGQIEDKHKRYAGNIITSSELLLDLINDLLDLAKIEAGRMDVHIGPMNVADTAEGLTNLIRPQAESKQITLDLSVDRRIPLVYTDAGKYQQIVFNFLSNAVKFTPQGGQVMLTVSLQATGTGHVLRTTVRDSGPGIPRDKHEYIFEKFTQLDSSVTRPHLGTGLGLTISRDLAKLLQGRIELDSEPGQGAAFSLVIPLRHEGSSPSSSPAAEGAEPRTAPAAS